MARPIKSRYVLDLLVMAYNRNEESFSNPFS